MSRFKNLGVAFNRLFRNDLNDNFSKVDTELTTQKSRVDNLIANAPQPSEVVDARGGAAVLRDRLDGVDEQLAQKANQDDVDIKISQLIGGSPKGAYGTTSELEAEFPNGDTGIYVIASDGNWYYWNGISWVSGGSYLTSIDAELLIYMTEENQTWEV